VRKQVRDSFITETSARLAADALEAVRDEAERESADLKSIAEENGFEHRELADLTRTQMENRRELDSIPDIVETLTAMQPGDVSDVIAGPRSNRYLFKVAGYTESHVPRFEEVRHTVVKDLDTERRTERMSRAFSEQRVRERLETALAEGTTFEEAAKAIKLDVTRHRRLVYRATERFNRRLRQPQSRYSRGSSYTGGTIPGMSGNHYKLVETVFKLQDGQISQPVREEDRRDAVDLAMQREFVTPEPPSEVQLDTTRATLQQILQENLQSETITQVMLRALPE